MLQMVWSDSRLIGCGYNATCPDDRYGTLTHVYCNYYTPYVRAPSDYFSFGPYSSFHYNSTGNFGIAQIAETIIRPTVY